MGDMCDSREKIIEDHQILQEVQDRIDVKKAKSNGDDLRDDILLLRLSKASFIHSVQSKQNSQETVNLFKKFPSLVYMIANMPLVILPLFLIVIIIVMRLSDPVEIVNLLSLLKMEATVETVKQSSLTVILFLSGLSGLALVDHNKKKEQEK